MLRASIIRIRFRDLSWCNYEILKRNGKGLLLLLIPMNIGLAWVTTIHGASTVACYCEVAGVVATLHAILNTKYHYN